MASGTLYTYPENWRAFKALILAQYSGAQVRVLSVPPHFHFGQTNCTPEFLRKFPASKVPAFEGDDGFCVFESNAIAYYVSNEELRGSTPEAAAQVVQWVSFADSDIVPPASTWVFPTLGIMHHNKQATENAKEEVRRILGLLDTHLKTRTFLVGERVTLADITVVCTLLKKTPHGKRRVLGKRSRSPRLSGKRRRLLPLLLRKKWLNVSRHWLLSQRPKAPLLTCPRVPLRWTNLSASTPMRTLSLWHCRISGSTLIRMAGPCGTLSTASLRSSLRPL
uniref:Elongation factor 1-gamma n=1 Tax=Canis lupus familiaris TaxID=9615 RepID=A0A8I3N445_CANLF